MEGSDVKCDVCRKTAKSGWRYCSGECRKAMLEAMREDGYLQAVPQRFVREFDPPGPRACDEGSGSWDNAVRAVEDG